jgi:hypothetical protein
MALPRKGSRRIVVEGVAYRWFGSTAALTAHHEEQPGSMLIVPLGRTWIAPPPLPSEVADLIRQALRQGWRPTEIGPPFRLPQPPIPPRTGTAQPAGSRRPTETDWQTATHPLWLLSRWHADPDYRQTLLVTVAACRLVWDHLPGVCREWVALVERVADEDLDPNEINIEGVFVPVRDAFRERLVSIGSPSQRGLFDLVARLAEASWTFESSIGPDDAHGAPLAQLVREVFGNPFQEVLLRRSGLNRTIRAIAETIYAEQHFTDLPILADALEEAECADAPILEHLRSPGPHVRGCWALDLVLREE